MFKVCIISCGMIANSAHIPAYKNFPGDYEICAVCDVNPESAEATAKRHGIAKWYTDAEKMLTAEKPDVVSVCVPNSLHKKYTLMALEYGANVICEKPLAVSFSDACEMFDLAKKQGRLLMACQSMRFTPDRLAAKKYIDEKGIGGIYFAELSRIRRRGIPYWGSFHMKKVSLGGAMCDIGVHMLDALVWLLGNPGIESVTGICGQNHKDELGDAVSSGVLTGTLHSERRFDPEEMDVEDFAGGCIKLSGGGIVNFKVAWAANMPECTDICILGKDAGIDLPEGKVYIGGNQEITLDAVNIEYDSPFAGHFCIIDNFRRVLKGEEKPIVTPEETKTVAAILEMFYLSAKKGREVSFKEISERN